MIKSRNYKGQAGYIALTSTIIIVFILVTITVTLNMLGFFGRFNILDGEFKEKSVGIAESCVEIAILRLSQNNSYSGGEIPIEIEGGTCEIRPIESIGGNKIIKAQGIFNEAYTNLEITVNSSTFDVISWKEVSKF